MIKYLGSKRRLVPVLGEIAERAGARTALDLFTGTTRVAQELRRRGAAVTAVDTARYSEVMARCWIETSRADVDVDELQREVERLDALPGRPGYFTETFCVRSRYLQPRNGERVDAVRDQIARCHGGGPLEPLLLTSLLLAADRVDSTTGVQMAYLKRWSPRSHGRLTLRVPELVDGPVGRAVRADATEAAAGLGPFDVAYLDPPYNQHRYFTNYHVWETLVAWDAPEHYGVACKRVDSRDAATRSAFDAKRAMPTALRGVVGDVDARVVVLSCNDESWVGLDELVDMCRVHGHVEVLGFDSRRYVGAQIGIHDRHGKKVGEVSRLRNVEYVVVAGPRRLVRQVVAPWRDRAVDPTAPAGAGVRRGVEG